MSLTASSAASGSLLRMMSMAACTCASVPSSMASHSRPRSRATSAAVSLRIFVQHVERHGDQGVPVVPPLAQLLGHAVVEVVVGPAHFDQHVLELGDGLPVAEFLLRRPADVLQEPGEHADAGHDRADPIPGDKLLADVGDLAGNAPKRRPDARYGARGVGLPIAPLRLVVGDGVADVADALRHVADQPDLRGDGLRRQPRRLFHFGSDVDGPLEVDDPRLLDRDALQVCARGRAEAERQRFERLDGFFDLGRHGLDRRGCIVETIREIRDFLRRQGDGRRGALDRILELLRCEPSLVGVGDLRPDGRRVAREFLVKPLFPFGQAVIVGFEVGDLLRRAG